MLKKIRLTLLLGIIAATSVSLATGVQASDSRVDVLEIKGVINPVVANYVERGLKTAQEAGAEACIIQMDTPGGLDTSMREIIQNIINSDVPVVVYVSPQGARAASAGVFITMSAHVAVMAPNTNIGAAHPVAIGEDGEAQVSEEMAEKIVNDASAYIRSIADAHGRNMDWAEKAVRESVSVTETEALELNVIDLIAENLDDLLEKIDGKEVKGKDPLRTKGVSRVWLTESFRDKILKTLSDPNSLASMTCFR